MPKIVPLVEGPGDIAAVPNLLYKILHWKQLWTWQVARPKQVRGLGALKKRLSDFLKYAEKDAEEGGILILCDLDDDCPKNAAYDLALQIEALALSCPVAIVFAHREYEAWFLASIARIAEQHNLFQSNIRFQGDVEEIRDPKGWLTKQMPVGRIYKETIHQDIFTSSLDLEETLRKSRSFRRLCHSIEGLVQMSAKDKRGQVKPYHDIMQ
ncbi:DUF4276 family protein [candidate division KSB1 bacterium]|nr:DUF4276 family protein [candidate division KSB1 bacterium]